MIGEEFGDALYRWKKDPSPENTHAVVREGLRLMQCAVQLEQRVAWYERDVPPERRFSDE